MGSLSGAQHVQIERSNFYDIGRDQINNTVINKYKVYTVGSDKLKDHFEDLIRKGEAGTSNLFNTVRGLLEHEFCSSSRPR
jgi:hypothetical protein